MLKAAFGKLMKQMEKAQEEARRIHEELEKFQVEGMAGGGMVRVVANAKKEILSVKFDPDTFNTLDRETLEELTTAAVMQALEKADECARVEIKKASSGLLGQLPEGLNITDLIGE